MDLLFCTQTEPPSVPSLANTIFQHVDVAPECGCCVGGGRLAGAGQYTSGSRPDGFSPRLPPLAIGRYAPLTEIASL